MTISHIVIVKVFIRKTLKRLVVSGVAAELLRNLIKNVDGTDNSY